MYPVVTSIVVSSCLDCVDSPKSSYTERLGCVGRWDVLKQSTDKLSVRVRSGSNGPQTVLNVAVGGGGRGGH